MGEQNDRDRQPSARYVERLADRLADKLLYELTDYGYGTAEEPSHKVRRAIEWCVIDAAKELRAENELRERHTALPRATSGRGDEQSAPEASHDAAQGPD